MKNFCESIFNYLIPSSVRSVITKELTESYGYTQEQAAEKLGITQPAVSQYLSGLRGKQVTKVLNNKKLMEWVKGFTAEVASGKMKLSGQTCEICAGKNSEDDLKPLLCLLELEERDKNERT